VSYADHIMIHIINVTFHSVLMFKLFFMSPTIRRCYFLALLSLTGYSYSLM